MASFRTAVFATVVAVSSLMAIVQAGGEPGFGLEASAARLDRHLARAEAAAVGRVHLPSPVAASAQR